MKRMNLTEDRKVSQQEIDVRETEAQRAKLSPGTASRPEAPCSCPGCFPLDV